jgi:hypothetical protein
MRPYLKKSLHKTRIGGEAQDEGPEFKPQYHKEKKRNDITFFRNNTIFKERIYCIYMLKFKF